MITDDTLYFCDATSLNTGAAGTYQIGTTIDLAQTVNEIGVGGQMLYVVVLCADEKILSGTGAGGLRISLATDSTASFTAGTATQHVQSKLFATATSGAGIPIGTVMLCSPLPLQNDSTGWERYLGVVQRTETNPIAQGKVSVFLTTNPTRWLALADGEPAAS